MSSEFGDIDGPTTRFLSRVAKDIEYLLKDCSPSPTNERFFREGVKTYEVGKVEIDGEVITIYSFNAGRVFNTLQKQTDNPDEEVEQFFAVDWPVQQESGQTYHSFYFKSCPSKAEIKKAYQIHQIKIAIENREVLQEFRCQNCSERVHWTNLRDDCEMSLDERVILLEKQVCNCESSVDLIREGLDDSDLGSATTTPEANREAAMYPMD